jgi:molybdopterin-binding protein
VALLRERHFCFCSVRDPAKIRSTRNLIDVTAPRGLSVHARLMKSDKLFSPREAAQILGISYPTLKQWIYKGKLRTAKTAGGHHRIPEREIDKYLYRARETGEVSERRSNFRRVSGRNQLIGRVTDVKVSGLMAQVSLSIGGQHITAVITADAVREMRLQKGQTVAALIKSTEVMILRD